MRPKKPKVTEEGDLFRARLDQIINMTHELVQLAAKLDWDWIDEQIAPLYSNRGRPGIETRSSLGCCCSSAFLAGQTRPCANAGSTIPISSTSPARRFSSTHFRTNGPT